MKFLLILSIVISRASTILIDKCYSSGLNCIKFETSQFHFSSDVRINSDDFPYLSETSDTSTRSILSDLLAQLVTDRNVSLAALVIFAGDYKNIQWKISPDSQSEHPISINNAIDFSKNVDNSSVYCFDGSEFTHDPEKIFIIPPDYQFFYTTTSTSSNCADSSLVVLPFVWDELSRSGIKGASYFTLSNCSEKCASVPISTSLVQLCSVNRRETPQVKIDVFDDFSIEMSDDLLGFTVKRINKQIPFPIGIIDCSSFMENSNTFGDNSICLGDGENVAVKFGRNPNETVLQGLRTRVSRKSAAVKYSPNSVFPNFTVSHHSEIASCTKHAKFEVKQISGNGFLPLTFEWKVLNGSDELKNLAVGTNNRMLNVPREYLSQSNILTVKACNIAGKCTISDLLITELVDDSSVFSVKIDGYEQETPTSFGLKLHANPNFQRCNDSLLPKDVQYEWQINGESQSSDDGLKIPAYRFGVEDYVNVTLIAKYNGEKYFSSNETKTIHYVGLPIFVSLDCVQKQIGTERDLTIYTNANDQNRKNAENLEYQWSCQVLNDTSEDCNFNKIDWNLSHLFIPAVKLERNKNKKLNFTVVVSSDNASDSSSCIVSVAPSNIPDVSFFRLAENKQNVNDYIRIQAVVQSSSTVMNITWEVVRDSQYGYFNISSILSNPTSIIENLPTDAQIAVSLTIPPASSENFEWVGLLTGKTFVIRLWATDENGASFSDLYLYTNSPPTLGKIDVSCDDPAVAFETPLTFSVGDGWNDDKEDLPLSYQFGFKTWFSDNSTSEFWLTKSTVKSYSFYLPSAGDEQNSTNECEQRIGYTALLKVCDRLESCVTQESDIITVQAPSNTTVAVSSLLNLINTDIVNGNLLPAIAKIQSLNMQLCTDDYDHTLSDKVMLLLFESLSQTNESSDYLEAIKAGNLLLPVVSNEILSSVMNVLSDYRRISGHLTTISRHSRIKRSAFTTEDEMSATTTTTETTTTTTSSSKVYKATESEANDLLKVYDILIVKDKPVVDVYFLNINDFLTGFCMQLDENSNRVMAASGSGYTIIQTQSVNPISKNYTGYFTIGGSSKVRIEFSDYFDTYFSYWKCGTATCRYVCLGSAWINETVMYDNNYMSQYFFSATTTDLTANKSVSDFYQISFIDPVSGTFVGLSTGEMLYTIDIMVSNYKPINYYNCVVYSQQIGWDETLCTSSNFASLKNDNYYIKCNCSSPGIVGVFNVNAPTPDPLPDHNEVQLVIKIDVDVSTDDLAKLFIKIAQLSEIDVSRFVKISNKGNRTITAILRPPFKTGQKSNSYSVQAIQKAISYQKLLNSITVESFGYEVVARNLTGDSNARKITMSLYRSYLSQLGNDADDYAKKWTQSIATSFQISEYRFKNAKIFFGVVFNFTITVAMSEEIQPLSADEIALMIQECSRYGELDFTVSEESVQVSQLQDSEIIKLVVLTETNALMLALVVVLSAVLGLGTLLIGGAVVIKLKTDKLIEEERRRAILNEQFNHPPPEYRNTAPSYDTSTDFAHRRQNNRQNY